MPVLSRHARLVVAGVTISLGATLVPVLAGGPAGATSSLCTKVTTAEVSTFLGVKATKVTTTVNGNVTVCWYRVGSNTQSAFVRVQTGDNKAGFNLDKKSAQTQGEKPKSDVSFGSLLAFSASLGSPSYGVTYSVTVLKKSTELTIGGVTTKLSNVEGLTKKVLLLV
ncbi:MAG TPA: hypothetical protein VGZ04_02950 [Acidimicrobiales bacterium]|jgi:hypothetical protein|nr:hypothetical protein [Acidimicrobiales bacterium]